MAAARPGSASAGKKPRSIQIAIEVEPRPDGGGSDDSFSDSSSEDETEDLVVTRRVPREGRRSPARRSPSPSRSPRRSVAEVVVSASDENYDGQRPPCRVHGGYSYGPAGSPAPRIPRRAHRATCRRITACTVPAMGPMMAPQPMYGAIGSAKGTRMDWKLFPDGTLNVTMGPPLKPDDDEKAAKTTKSKTDVAEGEAPPPAPEGEAAPKPKPVGSNMSLARIMTAGFMRPRLPVVFEAVIGPRPGLTPAVLKPPAEQQQSDTQISVVSRFECTCPPPPPSPPPKNEHAHCQELLLELLDRQEQAAQIPQINLITPARREQPMCQRDRRAMHIMEMAASADSAVLEEDRRRPTPLLHIMEKEYDYD
ncbi:hypothetical protein HPB50_005607 [Hyalomma asiaticum]|uniref:Uncharacterized protein n=1 Tax=Hyalomma asiaticum TaxID=266040 RepID=A0ACB7S7U1_HYAAI|nr:hypothetical protein HPB50_005607 [Hyalomma asiaticum]